MVDLAITAITRGSKRHRWMVSVSRRTSGRGLPAETPSTHTRTFPSDVPLPIVSRTFALSPQTLASFPTGTTESGGVPCSLMVPSTAPFGVAAVGL